LKYEGEILLKIYQVEVITGEYRKVSLFDFHNNFFRQLDTKKFSRKQIFFGLSWEVEHHAQD